MFDGLLGRGFSSKCKLLIKPTRTRIDVLWKRKEATQRFLKGNLAHLLANGLDINAYGRTEEFIAGQNVLSCYDFIERCCEYILKQLPLMQNQRECPEECRESIGSLMFAAARFPDMPELRDLRDLFQERYGTGLEHFVNHDFVEKIASKSSTTEKKLQFLQVIALEFSVKWDCRDFRSKLEPSSSSSRDQPKRSNGKDTISNPEKIINARKEYNYLNHDRNGIGGEPKNKIVSKKEADKPDSYHRHSNALPPPYGKPRENKNIDALEPEKLMNRGYREKGLTYYDDVPLPKPRSMRKKHSSQNGEEVANRHVSSSSSRNRRRDTNNSSGKGLQVLFEDEQQQKDEEELVIDKLLLHYSSKPSSFDPEKLIRKTNNAESRKNNPALIPPPPARSISLPSEKTGRVKPVKVYTRANSIQPAKHVHPKLPDYDDLAARFAALKER